jgi:hypothetical protein
VSLADELARAPDDALRSFLRHWHGVATFENVPRVLAPLAGRAAGFGVESWIGVAIRPLRQDSSWIGGVGHH